MSAALVVQKTTGIMIADPDGHASLLESTPHP